MVAEYNFENDFVVQYFINELEYKNIAPSVFNSELMLIPHVVEDFIYANNEQQCKEIIRKEFGGDKKSFLIKFNEEVSQYLYSNYNVAVQLHPKKHGAFKFMGKYYFNLYLAFNSDKEDKNIYSIVQQPVFKINTIQGKLTIIPDIGIFINGFLVSYLQLKLQHKGQNAQENGRGQIVGDYLETIKCGVVDIIQTNTKQYQDTKQRKKLVEESMKYFHAPIHMVAMDTSSAYIIRGIEKHYVEIEKLYLSNKMNDSELKKEILQSFFIDSLYKKESNLTLEEKCKKVLYNLYNKNNLQNEILYFNFLAYERNTVYNNGRKEYKNKLNTPVLNYPRPNQKFGVEKTIAEVLKKYENETNPNYEIERLEKRLNELSVPEHIKKRALDKRKAYKNNKNQFSMLLQYAAGFGKTYILCWLSLMLKDLMNQRRNGEYLFDKIMIISDRVDLRDQVDRAMQNMNIEKSLFAEADNRDTLKKFITEDTPRIIIVNIQKFPFLKDMLGEEEKELLKDKRTAFLIDEIHRSNSGTQHNTMTSLFDEVIDNIDEAKDKKNLIIGLTATPTDGNLARFGEYQGCLEDIKWIPFDSYTMNEAIEDGFTLDPTKSLIPCATRLVIAEEDGRIPSIKEMYENTHRIQEISKLIANVLVGTTYKKIYGYGKAMLACYSIDSALKYFDCIKKELEIITQNPKYANYKDAKVYIVYSNGQDYLPCHVVCSQNNNGYSYSNEKEVISAFKMDKNGIMIVVDKLQTGFDEPRLHTLFLDKEINGINAVQTLSRVNRTCKNKFDCLVVDFSKDNINISNIKNAFEKFSGVVVSEFDSYSLKTRVESDYKKILNTDYYQVHFNEFKKDKDDFITALKRQTYINNMINNEHSKKLTLNDCELYLNYLQKLGLINNVIEVDIKYKNEDMLLFLKECITLVREKLKEHKGGKSKDIIDFWFEDIGIIENHQIVIEEMGKGKIKDAKLKAKSEGDNNDYDVISLVREINQKEAAKEGFIQDYKNKLHALFEEFIIRDKERNDSRLILKLENLTSYDDQDISDEFKIIFKSTKRSLKDDNLKAFLIEIEDNISLIESDFFKYILNK